MRGRIVSKEVRMLMDRVLVPTVTHASETWTWNKCQKAKNQSFEMSYLREGCSVNRMDGESNENVNGRFGMSSMGERMSCEVVDVVKHST